MALLRLIPIVSIKPKKLGGGTVYKPGFINQKQQVKLAMTWLLETFKKCNLNDKIDLIILTVNKLGPAIDLKDRHYATANDGLYLLKHVK